MHATQPAKSVRDDLADSPWERGCRGVIDLSLAACVFVVPCLMGGRIALGQCVLATSAAVAALAWSASLLISRRPTWTATRIEPLLLAMIGLALLQVTPLPTGLLHAVSPQHRTLLPLWTGADGSGTLGTWQTISLNVGETRQTILMGLSYLALFYVATQRLRRVSDIERLLKWLAAAAGAMALFGIVQWLTSNGKFFWFYDYPLTTSGHRLKGAFTNRNHFAQFLALGCAPLLWWILKTLEHRSVTSTNFGRSKSSNNGDTLLAGLLLLLGVLVFAVLFSLSRGGTIALGMSVLVMLAALYRLGRLSGRVAGVLLGVSLIAGSLFLTFGYEKFSDRLDNWESDERLAVWDANWRIVKDFPLFGTGLGSHADAYPIYYDPPFVEVEFTHAENSYLQVASESGLVGFVLMLCAVACCVTWCMRTIRTKADVRLRTVAAAVSASLAANFVHAFVDFSWFVPGLMVIVVLLAACARRLDQLAAVAGSTSRTASSDSAPSRLAVADATVAVPRWLGLVTAAMIVSGGAWAFPIASAIVQAEPHWFAYLRLAMPHKGAEPTRALAAEDSEASASERIEQFKQRLSALASAAKLDPGKARVHLRLASSYLLAFDQLQLQSDDPMSLAQLRDAALVSQFDSVASMREWLQRACGQNVKYLDAAARHAKRAVQLCPLLGQAYVHLAELRFLEDLDPQRGIALLRQAQLVRPQSGAVQFAVGRQQWLDGQVDEALESWKSAFHQDLTWQDQILSLLVGNVPASTILERLKPDLAALRRLETRYLNDQQPLPEYPLVARAYAAALQQELANPECDDPVERLTAAAAVYHRLQDVAATEACLRRALEIDRSSFAARKLFGLFLYEQGQFSRASEHLAWCVRMSPQDRWLRSIAEDALAKSLRSPSAIQPAGYESPRRRR